jgi:hypothetical protein
MRWFAFVGGVGVLLGSLAGSANADGWRSGSYSPYTPSYSAPPGCATPGNTAPIPSTTPSTPTTKPTTPRTTP